MGDARKRLEKLLSRHHPSDTAKALDDYRDEILREAWETQRRFVHTTPVYSFLCNPHDVGMAVADLIKPKECG